MMIRSNRGQLVIEYILLLVVAASVAAILARAFSSRNEDSPGMVVKKWREIQKEIGEDVPDKCVGDNCVN